MKKTYLLLGIVFAILSGCRESLEDTYDEYTGDGPVRYVGICSNVKVESGWQRLTVSWENSLDPNVVKNKITCTADNYEFDTIVPAEATECVIYGLKDASYEIKVQAVDDKGNTSLTTNEVVFGRPYTDKHEEVVGFTRGISKHFFVKNNLVLFYGNWNTKIDRFWLEYTDMAGQARVYELDEYEFDRKYVLVENVNVEKPVVLKRRGRLAECPDEIPFPDYTLTGEPVLLSDFKKAMTERYGEKEFKNEFFNRVELELDYNLVSLEDILAFPNLKTLVLGKNRYMISDKFTNVSELSRSKEEVSLFCLEVAGKLLPDFKVERYNNHYFKGSVEGITDMGDANLKDLEAVAFWDMAAWIVTCSPVTPDFEGRNLLDNDVKTIWKPLYQSSGVRTFELVIDMKSKQVVDGVKIVQANVSGVDVNFLPESADISVSEDGVNWLSPAFVEKSTLGNTPGEATLIHFSKIK